MFFTEILSHQATMASLKLVFGLLALMVVRLRIYADRRAVITNVALSTILYRQQRPPFQ